MIMEYFLSVIKCLFALRFPNENTDSWAVPVYFDTYRSAVCPNIVLSFERKNIYIFVPRVHVCHLVAVKLF